MKTSIIYLFNYIPGLHTFSIPVMIYRVIYDAFSVLVYGKISKVIFVVELIIPIIIFQTP